MRLTPEEKKTLHELKKTIGKNIFENRRKQKIPLRRMSKWVGLRENKLDNYEIGLNELRLQDLVKISSVLNVKVGNLLVNND